MTYDSFSEAHLLVLGLTFIIAIIMGAVVNKTNFCTMGAVSDLVNIGDTGRMRAWLFAMLIAIIGVMVLETTGVASVDVTRPPYRGSNFAWLEYIIGGVMFGIGMTLGSGCGNKTLIRIGGGNIKSIMVFLVIAVCAYFMLNPFPGTDKTIYSEVFYSWTNPLNVSLTTQQDIGSVLGGLMDADSASIRLIAGSLIALILLVITLKSIDFRGSFDNVLGGSVVGLAVVGAWFVTASLVSVNQEDEMFSWTDYTSDDVWSMYEDDDRPRDVGVQSFTFINPIGQVLRYGVNGFENLYLTFGVVAVFGVIIGSFLWAIISKGFRIEWFASGRDFVNHFVGGILMGIGGILALGCTIGQAVTGISTLALGSFIAFAAIVFGSALTMKIQYYKMVYEDDATFIKAFLSSMADMRLLPNGMRKLDAV
ncbi:MAG: YeeE/YedE family protein [Gammaproteobacteria bacterium]|nr:YeeE/YedE family protein [Gammaproteobacteria bacterium]